MSALILPRGRYAQPCGRQEIDTSHYLAGSLIGATLACGSDATPTPYGLAKVLSLVYPGGKKGTILAGLWRKPNAPTVDNKKYFGRTNNDAVWSSNVEFLTMASKGTSGSRKDYFLHNSSTVPVNGTIPSAGAYTMLALVFDGTISSAIAFAYVDAGLLQYFTRYGTFPWNSSADTTAVAGNSDLGIYATYLAVWDDIVAYDDLVKIHSAPWKLFRGR